MWIPLFAAKQLSATLLILTHKKRWNGYLFNSPIWKNSLYIWTMSMSTPSQKNIQSETHRRENLNVNSVIVLSTANYFCLLNGGPSPQSCPRSSSSFVHRGPLGSMGESATSVGSHDSQARTGPCRWSGKHTIVPWETAWGRGCCRSPSLFSPITAADFGSEDVKQTHCK